MEGTGGTNLAEAFNVGFFSKEILPKVVIQVFILETNFKRYLIQRHNPAKNAFLNFFMLREIDKNFILIPMPYARR